MKYFAVSIPQYNPLSAFGVPVAGSRLPFLGSCAPWAFSKRPHRRPSCAVLLLAWTRKGYDDDDAAAAADDDDDEDEDDDEDDDDDENGAAAADDDGEDEDDDDVKELI